MHLTFWLVFDSFLNSIRERTCPRSSASQAHKIPKDIHITLCREEEIEFLERGVSKHTSCPYPQILYVMLFVGRVERNPIVSFRNQNRF